MDLVEPVTSQHLPIQCTSGAGYLSAQGLFCPTPYELTQASSIKIKFGFIEAVHAGPEINLIEIEEISNSNPFNLEFDIKFKSQLKVTSYAKFLVRVDGLYNLPPAEQDCHS